MSFLKKTPFRIFRRSPSLRVLFVAPEAAPFSKAGGLGEVICALPRALKRLGVDARVMIPRYGGMDLQKFPLSMEYEGLEVPTGSEKENEPHTLICNVRKHVPRGNGNGELATTYFLENEEYYEKRSNIYGYSDDAIRWALLSRGTLEFLKISRDWRPDIIVANDWQTGLLTNDLKTLYKNDDCLRRIASVFIIHNLYYQGMFDHHFVSEVDFDDGQSALPPFFDPRLLKVNGMRRGIFHADAISTVSPAYAREIMTPEYGELLHDLLKERRTRVYGILNGINYSDFNPATDEYIAENYDVTSIERRAENKIELQGRFGLTPSRHAFLIGIASRLIEQKGFDLLFTAAEPLLKELDMQFAVLGAGEAKYMAFFKELESRYPGRVGTYLQFDRILPRIVYAGADAVLIPSKFEPAGLVQLEAMRYGAVPIVRKTGGLSDTVRDYHEASGNGTGFVFKAFDPLAMMVAVIRACENFHHKELWRGMVRRCMQQDFSWDKSAEEYLHLFHLALGFKRQELGVEK